MAALLSRLPWTFFTRNSARTSRHATVVVFAEPRAKIRSFHSQQRRKGCDGGGKRFLTYAALVSGLGYILYSRQDEIRERVAGLRALSGRPVVHALAPPPNGGRNRDRYNFIADVVEISAPSVVYIEIKDTKRIDFFTGQPATTSNGSGFIVGHDGLILTNAHVVINKPNTTVKVRLHDGTMHTGKIEDVDMQSDLATVRINKTNLPVMKLGTSSNIRPGEFVVAIGSPLALSNTITSGVVSSVNRQSEELGLHNTHMGYIQTDAAITFGNSGGPLVNLNGEAIGINAMKVTAGISFAIPIDYAKEFLKRTEARRRGEKIQYGPDSPRRRYMGITMQSLMPDILIEMQQNNEYMFVKHGVLVWKVMVGSPAYNAGLQPGDILTHANDEPVVSSSSIYKNLEKPGTIHLQVIRRGQILNIDVDPEDV